MRLYLVKNFGWHVADYLDRFRPSYLPTKAGCVSSSMYVDDPSELNANRAILNFTPYEVWHVRIRIFCGVSAILAYADARRTRKDKYVSSCELVTRLNKTYYSPGRDNPLPVLYGARVSKSEIRHLTSSITRTSWWSGSCQ
ncbi:hypothetical protein I7I48_08395 [Histoplasma ohiense]|nr:hypothetical protein I7I48_08395 [Histoplasma ohiense (nom. inval.)]